jgi:vitamin B12 transporter
MRRPLALLALAALAGAANAQEAEVHTAPARIASSETTAQADVSTRLAARDPGANVRVLTRREFDAMPGRSVADVLRALPEVEVRRLGVEDTHATVSLRGAGPGSTLVLVDGEPVSDPGSALHSLDLAIPLDGVDRIEVLSGDASALYGAGAVGGAVNVVTRAADLGRSNVQCETRYAHGDRSLDAGTYRGAGKLSRALAAGFEIGRVESSGGHDGTDLAFDAAHVAGRLDTALGRVKLSAGYTGRGYGAHGLFGDGPSREETRTRTARLTLDGERAGWTFGSSLSVRAHHDDFTLEAARPGSPETLSDTDVFRVRLQARRALLGGFLALGGEATRERIHASFAAKGRDHGSLFAEYGRQFLDVAPARGGAHLSLRLDEDEGFGSRVSPRVSLAFSPLARVRLRASAGLAYRLPTFSELYGADARSLGDPSLRAESSKSVELGASADAGPLTLDVVAFARRGRHVIDVTRASPSDPYRVLARDRLDVDGLTAQAALSRAPFPLLSTLALQTTVLSVKGDAPPVAGGLFDPVHVRWDALVGLAHAATRLRAFTRVTYAARRTRGGSALQDARLGWQTAQGDIFEIYLEGENLWDRDAEEEPGAPLPGRRLLAGFHLTW